MIFWADFLDNNISIIVFGWVMDISNTTLGEDGDQIFCCSLMFVTGQAVRDLEANDSVSQEMNSADKNSSERICIHLQSQIEAEIERDALLLQV